MKRALFFLAVLFSAIMLIICPDNAKSAATESLALCAQTVIPGLFPFMVLGNMLVMCGGGRFLGKTYIAKKIFGTDGACVVPIITGLISGVPVGACVTAEMVKKGELSKESGEAALSLCNNPGPVFMLSVVPDMLCCDRKYGVILWLAVTAASFAAGRVFALKKHSLSNLTTEKVSISECMAKSVKNAVTAMICVCGFVVFFGVAVGMIPEKFGGLKLFAACTAEMTTAVSIVGKVAVPNNLKLVYSSMILSWLGFSAHAQVMASICDTGMSVKQYFKAKLLQTVLAPIFTAVILKLAPFSVNAAVTKNDPQIIALVYGFMLCLAAGTAVLFIFSVVSRNRKQAKE